MSSIERAKAELVELHHQKNELRKTLETSSTDSIVDCAYLMREIDIRIEKIKESLLAGQNHFMVDMKMGAERTTESLKDDQIREQRIKKTQSKEVKMWRSVAIIATAVLAVAVSVYIFTEL